MIPDVMKGLPLGIGMILVTVAIGFAIGWACQGPEEYYDETVEYAPEASLELVVPAQEMTRGV